MKDITWSTNIDGQAVAKLGCIPVAVVFYNGLRSKADPKKYRVSFKLPGFCNAPSYETVEEAKLSAERGIRKWFKEVL